MTQKFGGGRRPTGTPSLGWSSVVVIASLLAGASVVHNIYKPNLSEMRYVCADCRMQFNLIMPATCSMKDPASGGEC